MVKRIVLSILGIVLLGGILVALWWVNERERDTDIPKESFIPYNSAVVVHVNANANAELSPKIKSAIGKEIEAYKNGMLRRVVDTLLSQSLVDSSYILAFRVEGKRSLRSLYVLNGSGVFARGESIALLSKMFSSGEIQERKYDNRLLYTVKRGDEKICYAVIGGMVLVADSELYVEDAVKQLNDRSEGEKESVPRYKNVNRYFSSAAGLNVFLNTTAFSDLLPLLLRKDFMSQQTDVSKWFQWGALDGDVRPDGMIFNGFMNCNGLRASYPAVLKDQEPRTSLLDGVLPVSAKRICLLALSDANTYMDNLETYRYGAGKAEKIRNRKSEFARLFGEKSESEWRKLLKGEWGTGVLAYDASRKQDDGVLVVHVKAGSIAKELINKMLKSYAAKAGVKEGSLRRTFSLDKGKMITYFKMPVPDFAGVMWGDLFDNIATNYVHVEDNYVVFASSERSMQVFAKDYMRRLSVRDQEWYKKLRNKLSAKFNWMYLSETTSMLPYYEDITRGVLHDFLGSIKENMEIFSSLALQRICEGNMLYHTLFLSTEEVEQKQARVMWQTKLDGKLTMKPAVVVNHDTRERELFVQDENNTIYLINDAGRILWKLPIEGKINSEIYQVDMFKNGKLQYLFSSSTHLYLIDRNGNYLPRYPLAFKSPCEQGITVCDYENNKSYRIFSPGVDRNLYLYELSGNLVKGWFTPKSDNDIISKVYHFRVEGKDYIVYADRYRLYILDRKGKERVKISTLLNLSTNTVLYLTKQHGVHRVAFMDASGEVLSVDFRGNLQRMRGEKMIPGGWLNVEDVNNDGRDEFVYARGNTLQVYDDRGKLLVEHRLEATELGYPYTYRFSSRDTRVGLVDEKEKRLFLVGIQGMSKGFPIRGGSPFSIAFFDRGNVSGFYLFAGDDGNHILKYRVKQ